jgi:hypothetical protein
VIGLGHTPNSFPNTGDLSFSARLPLQKIWRSPRTIAEVTCAHGITPNQARDGSLARLPDARAGIEFRWTSASNPNLGWLVGACRIDRLGYSAVPRKADLLE